MDYSNMLPQEVKKLIRNGKINCQTSGMCNGYAQANLCILPKDYAFDFLLFCVRNPKPCPILEVGDVGSKRFKTMASEGDVCKDFPKYRIWKNGVLEKEVTDITDYWRDDFVYFLSVVLLALKVNYWKLMFLSGILRKTKMCLCLIRISNFNRQVNFTGIWLYQCDLFQTI